MLHGATGQPQPCVSNSVANTSFSRSQAQNGLQPADSHSRPATPSLKRKAEDEVDVQASKSFEPLKALQASGTTTSRGENPTFVHNPTQTNRDSTSVAAAPPKKGSYREILARAEKAKQVQTDFGKIRHKAGPKLSRRARRQAEEQEREQEMATPKSNGRTTNGKRMQRSKQDLKVSKDGRPKPKREPLQYKGTMRQSAPPNPGQPKQEQRGDLPTRMKPAVRGEAGRLAPQRYTYAASSDEEEEYDDDNDERDDDDSEEMEGGGFDELEQEEERALRAARREDLEARREEEAHRREKLERKKKLQNLAANTPKQRY